MKREACASLLAPHWRGRAFHCGAACSPSTAFFPRLLSSSTALHLQRTKTVASSVIVAPSPLFPPVAKPPNRFLLSSYACYATSSSSSSSSSSSGKRSSSSSRKGYLEKQRKTVEHIQHGGGAAAKKTTKKPKDNERLAPVTSDRDKKSALLSQRKTRKGIDKFAAAEGSPSSRKKKTATTRRKERSDETSQPVEFVGQVGLVNPPSKTAALKPRLKKKEEERYLTVHDPEYQNLPPPLHLEDVVRLLKEEKALRLFAVDISQKCNYTNYMITVEGRSGRHMRGMAEKILAAVCSLGLSLSFLSISLSFLSISLIFLSLSFLSPLFFGFYSSSFHLLFDLQWMNMLEPTFVANRFGPGKETWTQPYLFPSRAMRTTTGW
ncbi:Ribosome silencing factor (Fragment), variant 2 [Balamuthia mandrillaris]